MRQIHRKIYNDVLLERCLFYWIREIHTQLNRIHLGTENIIMFEIFSTFWFAHCLCSHHRKKIIALNLVWRLFKFRMSHWVWTFCTTLLLWLSYQCFRLNSSKLSKIGLNKELLFDRISKNKWHFSWKLALFTFERKFVFWHLIWEYQLIIFRWILQ